jgi:hypothetical protein
MASFTESFNFLKMKGGDILINEDNNAQQEAEETGNDAPQEAEETGNGDQRTAEMDNDAQQEAEKMDTDNRLDPSMDMIYLEPPQQSQPLASKTPSKVSNRIPRKVPSTPFKTPSKKRSAVTPCRGKCPVCLKTLSKTYIPSHMKRQHRCEEVK